MVQVYKIKDSRYYTLQDNEIMVELPDFEALIFNIDKSYFRIEITENNTLGKNFEDFIYNSDDYNDIVDSAITKYLAELTYNNLCLRFLKAKEYIATEEGIDLERLIAYFIKCLQTEIKEGK